MSPSSSETNSGNSFQIPKIIKTYIDFKKTLSESEGESFLKFVNQKIENLTQPVNDIEAWLASKTKAGQNRWEVYYQNYQSAKKAGKPNSDSYSVINRDKQKAIANFQKQIKQQKSGQQKTDPKLKKEVERLLDNPNSTFKSIDQLDSLSKPMQKPLSKRIAEGCEELRNLRMKNYFANKAVQGGMA